MRLLDFIKINIRRRRCYFEAAAEDITRKNINNLKGLSIAGLGLSLLFLLLAPLLIKDWTMTAYHAAVIIAAAVFCVIVRIYSAAGRCGKKSVTALCVVFWIMTFAFAAMADIFVNPAAPCCFMPIVLIALPAVFILPMRLSFGIAGAFELLYIAGLASFKGGAAGQYDLFCSLCAFCVSVVIYCFIMSMRAGDYETRAEYERLSAHDTLITSIYNKQSAQTLINRYAELNNPVESCAFIMLDVNNFKRINDTYGHQVGDRALIHVGEVLLGIFAEDDIIARFGGDEFIVLKASDASEKTVAETCERICGTLKANSETDAGVPIECSIGAVIAENQEVDGFDGLFCQADAAMYSVKRSGKGHYAIINYNKQQ